MGWLGWLAGLLSRSRGNIPAQVFLAAAIFFAGALLWQVDQRRVAPDNLALGVPRGYPGRALVEARVRIISAVRFHRARKTGPLFSAVGPSTTFFAQALRSRVHGRWRRVTGVLAVRVNGDLPVRNNQQVQITGWLSRPAAASNPGGFDYRGYLADWHVLAQIQAAYVQQVRVINTQQQWFPLSGWLDAWRARLGRRLIRIQPPYERRAGHTLVALLLGYRSPAIQRLARAFSRTGAAHLLALSGLHVVIIAAVIWLMLGLFLRRPAVRALATMALIFIYMLWTPCGPPVVRAAIATELVLLMLLRGRPPRILNILAITAAAVLVVTPAALFAAPFQLSFIITLALLALGTRVHAGLLRPWLEYRGDLDRIRNRWWAWLSLRLEQAILATVTANLIGSFLAWPLVAEHYHQINPWGVLTGTLLFPLVVAALVVGLVELTAVIAAPAWGHAMAAVGAPVVNWLAWSVQSLAHLPLSSIVVRSPPPVLVAVFFLVVLVWVFRRRFRLSRADVTVAFLAWLVALSGWYACTQPHGATRLWVMDAASGNALVLETPTGRVVLIDAGTLGSPARLTGSINQLLGHDGLRHIDAVVAGQIDSAHASALPALAVSRGGLAGFCDWPDLQAARSRPALRRFFSAAAASGLTFTPLAAGEQLRSSDQVRLTLLWPPAGQSVPRSHRSCIMLLHFGQETVLILSRTQGVRVVLDHLNLPHSIAAAVLTGGGNLRPGLARWLHRLNLRYVIACGEARAAVQHDRRWLKWLRVPWTQTARTGAVCLILHQHRVNMRYAP